MLGKTASLGVITFLTLDIAPACLCVPERNLVLHSLLASQCVWLQPCLRNDFDLPLAGYVD